MRQQQTFRGFIFILLMLILIATAVRFPYARQADKVTNQDFIKILEDGQAADVSIHQNPQTPTGEVVLTLLDGQVKRLYVSDVKDAQKLLEAHDMAYTTMDVPQENYLVTIILPFMLSIVVVVIIIMVMNRSAGGGGANARMMNFGKSRARMSRDSKVNFSNVAGLVEEKEELETGITFFLRDNLYGREQLAQIQGALAAVKASEKELDLGSLELKMKNVQEEDWANNWKKYFKPFPVGEKIMIKPSWEELTEETDKVILKIDPGHIFGTGTHETTQLCMELIEKYVKKDDMVLDIGCGSGILSIASLLLEAKEADAVDIDPNAIAIAYENSDRNDIPREKYHVCAGNILEDAALHEKYSGKKYDMVEANIVADIIIALTKQVPDYIKDGGIFLSSGIITERKEDVLAALAAGGFDVQDVREKKGWVAIASKYVG